MKNFQGMFRESLFFWVCWSKIIWQKLVIEVNSNSSSKSSESQKALCPYHTRLEDPHSFKEQKEEWKKLFQQPNWNPLWIYIQYVYRR